MRLDEIAFYVEDEVNSTNLRIGNDLLSVVVKSEKTIRVNDIAPHDLPNLTADTVDDVMWQCHFEISFQGSTFLQSKRQNYFHRMHTARTTRYYKKKVILCQTFFTQKNNPVSTFWGTDHWSE